MKLIQTLAASFLAMSLAACGGGGGSPGATNGGGNGNNGGSQTPGGSTKNVLFVGDSGNHGLASFTTLSPAAGSNVAANVLGTGSLAVWYGIALDTKNDRLYAATGQQIAVFDKASSLNGTIAPTRMLNPVIKTGVSQLYGMVYDKTNDRLYIGYSSGLSYSLAVFEAFSSLSGSISPTRYINNLPSDNFAIDTKRAVLYVGNPATAAPAIYTYAGVDKINGTLPAVNPSSLVVPGSRIAGLAVDELHDRLYLGVPGTGVAFIDNADAGGSKPTIVGLANSATSAGLAFDSSNDRLYAGLDNTVFVLSNASQLNAGNNNSAIMVAAPAGSKITTFAF